MKMNMILLSSVATLSLAGAIMLAEPAVAQSDLNPPQYSSPAERAETQPAERAETQQLNEQYSNGTTQSPAALNGETPATQHNYPASEQPPYGSEESGTYGNEQSQPDTDTDEYPQQPNGAPPQSGYQYQPGAYPHTSPDGNYGPQGQGYSDEPNGPQPNSQPNEDQQTYQQQMQQYQDQQQDYQDQRSQYESDQHRYRHNLSWYDQARWNYDYPHAYAYEFDEPRLQRLYLIAEPSQQLSNAPVEGPNGVWVGRVRNIETGPDGRPARVEVALNRRVSVWVRPGDLRFDPRERVVYTDLTRHALWEMPGATVESGPL